MTPSNKHEDSVPGVARDGVYIGQASELVGASAAQIRAWEMQGLVTPARSAAGYRLYSFEHIERLRRIRRLVTGDRLRLDSILEQLDDALPDAPPNRTRSVTQPARTVGGRIRALRTEAGLSLRDLAASAGTSASYLSGIERSINSPSVAALQKIAAALGSNLVAMLTDAETDDQDVVVHRRDRRRLPLEVPGVVIEELAGAATSLESLVFHIEPGAGSVESYSHVGEEVIYVVTGAFELTLDEQSTHHLDDGDSVAFDSLRPHRWRNPGSRDTVVIWVNTPRTF